MKKILSLAALMFPLQACADAWAEEPNPINVVVEQAGDSARIIVAWGASQPGTYPISHYWLRLIHSGDESTILRGSQTTYTVDTLYHPWAPSTELFRVGVQAEDTQGNTSSYIWSNAFQLLRPFFPPGDPGMPSTVIDTSEVIALDMFRILPDSLRLVEGFGSTVFEGRFYAQGRVVACGIALLSEVPLEIVGMGDCGIALFPVDSVYDPWGQDFTTPAELRDGLRWVIR